MFFHWRRDHFIVDIAAIVKEKLVAEGNEDRIADIPLIRDLEQMRNRENEEVVDAFLDFWQGPRV